MRWASSFKDGAGPSASLCSTNSCAPLSPTRFSDSRDATAQGGDDPPNRIEDCDDVADALFAHSRFSMGSHISRGNNSPNAAGMSRRKRIKGGGRAVSASFMNCIAAGGPLEMQDHAERHIAPEAPNYSNSTTLRMPRIADSRGTGFQPVAAVRRGGVRYSGRNNGAQRPCRGIVQSPLRSVDSTGIPVDIVGYHDAWVENPCHVMNAFGGFVVLIPI